MRTIMRAMALINRSLQLFFRRPAPRMAKLRTPVDMAIPDSRPVWGLVDGHHRVHGNAGNDLVDVRALDDAADVEAAVVEEGMTPLEPKVRLLHGRHALGGAHVSHPHDLGEIEAGAHLVPPAPRLAEEFHGADVGPESHLEGEPVPVVAGGGGNVLHVHPAPGPLALRRIRPSFGQRTVLLLELRQQARDGGVEALVLTGELGGRVVGNQAPVVLQEVDVLQGSQRGRLGCQQGGRHGQASVSWETDGV